MDGWLEFVLERYNYWIVIVLMMTGLYTVFARGNLVKKVVGLNLFQTSVFIFYITIGKIAGGTAPIYIGGELDHGDGHGDGHGEGAGHGAEYEKDHGDATHAVDHGESLHDAPANDLTSSDADLHDKITNDLPSNDLKAALEALEPGEHAAEGPSLHEIPEGADKISNQAISAIEKPPAPELKIAPEEAHAEGLHEGAANTLDHAVSHGEIIYTNPLPHVLILTAIVVGVATTAVGLALAVRIREAYGTIEEDELEAIDDVAEFGDASIAVEEGAA